MFDEADRWLKNAKTKLDYVQANANVPNFIAFEMLANAKSQPNEEDGDGEDLLIDESGAKNSDIVAYGEVISDRLSTL